MTTAQIKQLAVLDKRKAAYQAALDESVISGVAAAGMSNAGSSQNYTRLSPAAIRTEITKIDQLRDRILRNGSHRRTSPDFG